MNKRITSLVAIFFGACFIVAFKPEMAEDESIAVMSFNIRYNNPDDAPNDWPNRRDWVGELIEFYNPDLIGTQEVLHDQLVDMLNLLPAYDHIGVGRKDGKEAGEYSAILYKKDKYDLLQSATFWLSETPKKPGKGWDAANIRIVTWGEFREKSSGDRFFFFNTHFDHRGEVARKESAKLLLKKASEIAGDTPAIITGDFNASPESEVYRWLTNGVSNFDGLYDSYKLASNPYGPEWTFNAFGKAPVEERSRIDYIFLNKKAEVSNYVIISEQRGEVFPSDHLPIMAEITFD